MCKASLERVRPAGLSPGSTEASSGPRPGAREPVGILDHMPLPAGFDPSAPASAGGLFGLPSTPEDADVVVIPVPWEATVSYGAGTARGPQAVLDASRQVDLLDRETGRPYAGGIAMLPIPDEVRRWSEE